MNEKEKPYVSSSLDSVDRKKIESIRKRIAEFDKLRHSVVPSEEQASQVIIDMRKILES